MINLLKPLLGPAINKALDLIPNKNARAEAQEELENNILNAVVGAQNAQNRVNEAEAKHESRFVAGWRPGIGWVCAVSLFIYFVPQFLMGAIMWSLLAWKAIQLGETELPPYPVDANAIMGLVGSMLGMGGIRMLEKKWGVARNSDPGKK